MDEKAIIKTINKAESIRKSDITKILQYPDSNKFHYRYIDAFIHPTPSNGINDCRVANIKDRLLRHRLDYIFLNYHESSTGIEAIRSNKSTTFQHAIDNGFYHISDTTSLQQGLYAETNRALKEDTNEQILHAVEVKKTEKIKTNTLFSRFNKIVPKLTQDYIENVNEKTLQHVEAKKAKDIKIFTRFSKIVPILKLNQEKDNILINTNAKNIGL